MRSAEDIDRRSSDDPIATRSPSPGTFEAMLPSDRSIASYPDASASPGVVGVGLVEFERALVEQGLMGLEALDGFRRGSAVGERVDAVGLARALVREGRLTRYQAAAIYQGKARSLTIGPYILLDKLGSGGMGMVFKARRRPDGPVVALKLLPPSASRKGDAVQRFRREAELMARLDHPNIVAAHEVGEYGGVHYLVMDFVEGRDLHRVVGSGGPLKPSRAVDFVLQAARGLRAAHDRGIVHRDIKPANLLLDDQGVVRVLDLGLARITLGVDSGSGPSLTQSGVIMGTVDYLPPEQSDDSKRADHRADIYSLACTLHYLLTARSPFTGESVVQRLIAHHQRPIPALRESRPEVPPALEALFARMMAKAPEDRPQSMAEVIAELEAIRASPAPSRGLLVFDDGRGPVAGGSKSRGPGDSSVARDAPSVVAELSGHDLLTFVRTELLAPDEAEPGSNARVPAPPRRRKSSRRRRASAVAIAAAALALSTLGALVGIVVSRSFMDVPRAGRPIAKVPRGPEVRDAADVPVKASIERVAGKEAGVPPEPPPARAVVPEVPDDRPPPPRLVDVLRPLLGPPPPEPGAPLPALRPGDPGYGPFRPEPDALRRGPRPGDPEYGPVPGSPGYPGRPVRSSRRSK